MITLSKEITRSLVLLFLLSGISAQAQEFHSIKKESAVTNKEYKWVQATELPVEATETDNIKKKSSFLDTTMKWLRKDLPGDFQIHGFLSQAYIVTSENNVFGNSDSGGGGSFGLTEAGLNASVRPLPKLLLSAQVLSRRAGEGNTGMPRLDYGFLDYRLYSHEANQFGIRVGRLKNPFGFYNDTRDVAFTRPSILLPQSIYFDRTRNLGLSSDSVQLYSDLAHSNLGSFSTQFGIALPVVGDKDTAYSFLTSGGANLPGHLTREVSYIGRGIYESNDKRIRLAVSGSWVNIGYDPSGMLDMGAGSIQFSPIYFSAQYNAERWSLTSEYALRHFVYDKNFTTETLKSGLNGLDFYGESFYFQGEYRFTPKLEGILRYDVLFTDRADRDGKEFAAKTKNPAHTRFAKDITVGLRWNVTPQFMLRAEYHNVNGTGWLSTLDNIVPQVTDQHWHLFAIQASFRF
jgi:hypothetical protein